MRKLWFGAVVATAMSALSAPASAQSYDAFTGFKADPVLTQNGAENGNFIYGEVDATSGAPGSFFGVNTNCAIAGTSCLQSSATVQPNDPNSRLPGVYKTLGGAFPFGTVNVPSNSLVIHPDDDTDLTFIAFVAPTTGLYNIYGRFAVADDSPTGVTITRLGTQPNGAPPITYGQTFLLNGATGPITDFQRVQLNASQAIGYGIGNDGLFFNDSTGVRFSVFAVVPEASTWAMMILGVGAIGAGLRRRRVTTRAKIAFA